jgi:hypothetical protein
VGRRSSSLVTVRFWRVLVLGGVVYMAGLAMGLLLGGVLIATSYAERGSPKFRAGGQALVGSLPA